MARESSHGRPEVLDQVAAGRRAVMLRFAIAQQERGHYAEAQDVYRQLIEGYPGTDEEAEARERILDMAHTVGSENQPHRMLARYKTVERLYATEGAPSADEGRRARVREILDEIHERDRPEKAAEKRAQAEADPSRNHLSSLQHRVHRSLTR